jgi:LmbE family N-acetylglucosaminyl deacetylase
MNVLVIAPHPDDETLGCGGTLLRHVDEGDDVYWLIVTNVSEAHGHAPEKVKTRAAEIDTVAERFGFAGVVSLDLAPTQLDTEPMSDLVGHVGDVMTDLAPGTVYVPNRSDIHTDHAVVFDAVAACTKWFRYPFVERVLAYETMSETDFALSPDSRAFRPNVFVDISPYLDEKISIMHVFESEVGLHPFPRSERTLRALAEYRGSTAGYAAAEAFMLLRERVSL